MHLDRYKVNSDNDLETFEFVSVGVKGRITKVVQYAPTNYKNLYNLGFGDKLPKGDFDDKIISNNGDTEKVLATVAATLYAFTDRYREAMIYLEGSTKSRTRLYRIGITKYIDNIIEHFEVLGETKNGWEQFEPNSDYNAFLITRKI